MKYLKVGIVLFLSIAVLLGCSNDKENAHCNSSKRFEDPEIEKHIGEFFRIYNSQEPVKAIDYIFSTNSESISADQVESLKSKLDSTYRMLGVYTGYSKISSKLVSTDLYFCSYLIKHRNIPLRFNFVFYRPEKRWVLLNFSYDADVVEELKESGKIYFLE